MRDEGRAWEGRSPIAKGGPVLVRRRCERAGVSRDASPAGFTLVELLVVIAILAVLASLLFPALSRGRDRVRAVLCRHHLRQWALGTHLYAADHEDYLPPEGVPNPSDRHTNTGWYIQLQQTLGLPRYHDQPWRTNPVASLPRTPWLCPSNSRRSNGNNLFHYCLNQHVDGTSSDETPVRLGELRQPAQMVWLFDSKNLPAVGGWGFVHTNLHGGGAHFAFLDGHVAHFPRDAYWDKAINRGRTNHASLLWQP